jgi:hypothetical protein
MNPHYYTFDEYAMNFEVRSVVGEFGDDVHRIYRRVEEPPRAPS